MTGVEKVCEFSGEYVGYDMYVYKRNHIQIKPEYRKLFRGADCVLHFYALEIQGYENEQILLDYCLEVKSPELQGVVDGAYHNYCIHRDPFYGNVSHKTIIRRMKRLTRNRNLRVIYHDCNVFDWLTVNK